jgi:HAD superfamily hydrolase (TIGR01509 family)
MAQPDLIIFDCDGVLIDSEAIACRTDSACLAEIGIAMSAEDIMERYVGISTETMLADIAQCQGKPLPADFPQTLRERIAAAFETELRPIEGVEPVLRALPFRRCVASSSAPARLQHSLSLTGLLHCFQPHIFSATQVARGKPAPDLFLFAAASMQAAPDRCVVTEDSEAGVRAAVAAGMQVIGFTGGGHCRPGHAERLHAAGAGSICDAMRRLPGLLASA